MRVWMLVRGVMLRDVAGTKEPIWERRHSKATWRTKEDFPPMLGPVIRRALVESGDVERCVLFGMYEEESSCSTIG